MKPESKFVAKVKKDLMTIPGVWFFKTQEVANRGIPDIICCLGGYFVALEAKVPPNRLKPGSLQAVYLSQIMECGGYAREITPENWPQIFTELKNITEGTYDGMVEKTTGIFADEPPAHAREHRRRPPRS